VRVSARMRIVLTARVEGEANGECKDMGKGLLRTRARVTVRIRMSVKVTTGGCRCKVEAEPVIASGHILNITYTILYIDHPLPRTSIL